MRAEKRQYDYSCTHEALDIDDCKLATGGYNLWTSGSKPAPNPAMRLLTWIPMARVACRRGSEPIGSGAERRRRKRSRFPAIRGKLTCKVRAPTEPGCVKAEMSDRSDLVFCCAAAGERWMNRDWRPESSGNGAQAPRPSLSLRESRRMAHASTVSESEFPRMHGSTREAAHQPLGPTVDNGSQGTQEKKEASNTQVALFPGRCPLC